MGARNSWIVAATIAAASVVVVLGVLADAGDATTAWRNLTQALNERLGLPAESFLTRNEILLFFLCLFLGALLVIVAHWLAGIGGATGGQESGGTGSTAEDRVRQLYLAWFREDIENRWRASIHCAHFVDLGLDESPKMTEGWTHFYQAPNTPVRIFSSIRQAFETFGGRLLLLGSPGSGKSTSLLYVAQHLLREAQSRPDAAIPLLLNLSSFKLPRQPLLRFQARAVVFQPNRQRAETETSEPKVPNLDVLFERWLMDQLERLQIVRGIGPFVARWYREGRIAFLLDGFDEVDKKELPRIAQALNVALHYSGPSDSPAVVCSRIVEYERLLDLQKGLALRGAVTLQPLDPSQINSYLNKAEATGLREALAGDANLYELARTPLILSMMVLAYHGLTPDDIPTGSSLLERRHNLFESYISRMMQHQARKPGKPFPPAPREQEKTPYSLEEVHRYLGWLAVRLNEEAKTVFTAFQIANFKKHRSFFFSEFRLHNRREDWTELTCVDFLVTSILSTVLLAGILFGSGRGLMMFAGSVLAMMVIVLLASSMRRWVPSSLSAAGGLVLIPLAIHMTITQALAVFFPKVPAPALGLAGLVLLLLVLDLLAQSSVLKYKRLFALLLFTVGLPLLGLVLADRLDFAVWTVPLGMALASSLYSDDPEYSPRGAVADCCLWVLGLILGAGYGHWMEGLPTFLPAFVLCLVFWISFTIWGELAMGLGLATGALAGVLLGGAPGAVFGALAGAILALRLLDGPFAALSRFIDRWLRQPCLRLILWVSGHLPLRFQKLINYGVEILLLTRASDGYEFAHRLLRDHFAMKYLISSLWDKHGNVRLNILNQLSRQGESSREILGQLAEHPSRVVREAATAGLGRLAPTQTLDESSR